jgi:hypothetical protein
MRIRRTTSLLKSNTHLGSTEEAVLPCVMILNARSKDQKTFFKRSNIYRIMLGEKKNEKPLLLLNHLNTEISTSSIQNYKMV